MRRASQRIQFFILNFIPDIKTQTSTGKKMFSYITIEFFCKPYMVKCNWERTITTGQIIFITCTNAVVRDNEL